ncbi:hypothetical protein GCM10009678_26250 [Actinomadura kijaniata]|uniref:Secreted protein n=1 Tax=Actinomadura namibiensis TaxID=182080 RepID=A0A7W3QPH1_ACTNM|nr:hypothetical protein [Actinomadura namibiensis]MBA8954614.1 hypothetical protein [Actinomadura namibiensis]
MSRSLARTVVVGLVAALPLGGAFALSAQAAYADDCSLVESSMEFTGAHVVAEKYRICTSGRIIRLSVTISQKDPSSGVWKSVATGVGVASYGCQGSSPSKRYRIGTGSQGTLLPCA